MFKIQKMISRMEVYPGGDYWPSADWRDLGIEGQKPFQFPSKAAAADFASKYVEGDSKNIRVVKV